MSMLSSPTEKQVPIGVSAEEADLLRRSKKKTKRGLSERDDAEMEIEEDGRSIQVTEVDPSAEIQKGQANRPVKSPTISFKSALTVEPQSEAVPPEAGDGAPASATATTTEFSPNPTWKAGEIGAGNQGNRGPLGDKYGSWMIANRKSRTYQNSEDTRRNSGKNQGGRKEIPKGKSGGNQGNKYSNFNKEGFKVWDNSRFGALQNLEDETEDEAQEETNPMDRPEGLTGALSSGKGRRPQIQTTEAQIMNDKSEPRKESNMTEKATSTIREEGYDKGNRVVRTTVTEEGNTMEEVQTPPEGGDHHQDPPDPNSLEALDGPGDPMAGVEFTEGPSTSGLGVVLQ
nr:uncharacterized protein LOC109158743 [Ipomoea trifida]